MKTVLASQLLWPNPHYMDLGERYVAGRTERYQGFQFKPRRPFSRGLTWQLGYNCHRPSRDTQFNDIDGYDNKWTRLDAISGPMGGAEPRHHPTFRGVYDVQFGKGRAWGAHMHPMLNGIVGGWTLSAVYFWNSSPYLVFPQAEGTGDPQDSEPDPEPVVQHGGVQTSSSRCTLHELMNVRRSDRSRILEPERHPREVLRNYRVFSVGVKNGSLRRNQ